MQVIVNTYKDAIISSENYRIPSAICHFRKMDLAREFITS
jgi:hypothetical protein